MTIGTAAPTSTHRPGSAIDRVRRESAWGSLRCWTSIPRLHPAQSKGSRESTLFPRKKCPSNSTSNLVALGTMPHLPPACAPRVGTAPHQPPLQAPLPPPGRTIIENKASPATLLWVPVSPQVPPTCVPAPRTSHALRLAHSSGTVASASPCPPVPLSVPSAAQHRLVRPVFPIPPTRRLTLSPLPVRIAPCIPNLSNRPRSRNPSLTAGS
jgi:hypothetical protein